MIPPHLRWWLRPQTPSPGVVLAALATPNLPVPDHTASQARDAARHILARREYREPARPLLERARDALFDFIGRLLARIVEGATGSPVGWAVVAVVVAVLVVLVVRFARSVTADPERSAVGTASARRPARAWRAEADVLEARGEWRAALRCRYRALVADLAARGLVDEIPGRTAGEYRSEVAVNAPLVAPDFDGATSLFERAWYGGAPTGADEATRFHELERHVLAGVS